MFQSKDYCQFCEFDGSRTHAPRCPVQLESEIEGLVAALRDIAKQQVSQEMNFTTRHLADFQDAYERCVIRARKALEGESDG